MLPRRVQKGNHNCTLRLNHVEHGLRQTIQHADHLAHRLVRLLILKQLRGLFVVIHARRKLPLRLRLRNLVLEPALVILRTINVIADLRPDVAISLRERYAADQLRGGELRYRDRVASPTEAPAMRPAAIWSPVRFVTLMVLAASVALL